MSRRPETGHGADDWTLLSPGQRQIYHEHLKKALRPRQKASCEKACEYCSNGRWQSVIAQTHDSGLANKKEPGRVAGQARLRL